MKNSVLIICCLAVIMAGASSCGKKAKEKVAENLVENLLEKSIGKNANIDISDGKVNITTEDGSLNASEDNVSITTEEGKINIVSGAAAKKVDFPEDLFKYAGAEVTTATVSPSGYHFGLKSSDNSDKVFNTCKAEMEKRGWESVMAAQKDGEGMTMMTKEGKTCQIVVAPVDNVTNINIVYGTK